MFSKVFISLIMFFSVFGLSACSNSKSSLSVNQTLDSAQIVHGKPVVLTDLYAKHTVAISPPHKEEPCTGVIISAHHILSAGHCADYFANGDVYFGLVAKTSTAVVYKIKKITVHPKYCEMCLNSGRNLVDGNDLAIVEFEENLPTGFEPVEFATLSQFSIDSTVHLAGYGADEKYSYDNMLKVTQVLINKVGSSEFLTDETHSGTCSGDSGGPAFMLEDNKLFLVGITSRGDSQCRQHGIYTIPAAHLEWINAVVVGN